MIMGTYVCYYCGQMTAFDKKVPGDPGVPVRMIYALTKPIFGKSIEIRVCERLGCIARAKADGYEYRRV